MTTIYKIAYSPLEMAQWLDTNVNTNTQFVSVTQQGSKYTAFIVNLIS